MSENEESPAGDRGDPAEPLRTSLLCGRCGRPVTVLVLTLPYLYLCHECLERESGRA